MTLPLHNHVSLPLWKTWKFLAFFLALINQFKDVSGNSGKTCREDPALWPHMASYWTTDFGNETGYVALCNGKIEVQSDGSICVEGRVTFKQLREALNKPVYRPTAETVSVNGMLITGSCGVVQLGPKWHNMFDFVKSYTINNVKYNADSSIIDNTFAASRGTIDGFCLYRNFTEPSEQYTTTFISSSIGQQTIDSNKLKDAFMVHISKVNMVAEFVDYSNSKVSGFQEFFDYFRLNIWEWMVGRDPPTNIAPLLPGIMSLTGTVRDYLFSNGVYNTKDNPAPFSEDGNFHAIQQIEVHTEWSTFLKMVDLKFFEQTKLDLDTYIGVKHVTVDSNTLGCFKEDVAAISIATPISDGAAAMFFVDRTLLTKIREVGGTFLFDAGQQVPPYSRNLDASLYKLQSCGVELDLNVKAKSCYHPLCKRARGEAPGKFRWPEEYYVKTKNY